MVNTPVLRLAGWPMHWIRYSLLGIRLSLRSICQRIVIACRRNCEKERKKKLLYVNLHVLSVFDDIIMVVTIRAVLNLFSSRLWIHPSEATQFWFTRFCRSRLLSTALCDSSPLAVPVGHTVSLLLSNAHLLMLCKSPYDVNLFFAHYGLSTRESGGLLFWERRIRATSGGNRVQVADFASDRPSIYSIRRMFKDFCLSSA